MVKFSQRDLMAFARLLKQLRGDKSQEEFAAKLGVSRGVISNPETGKRPPSESLYQILLSNFPNQRHRILKTYAPIAAARRSSKRPRAVALPAALGREIESLVRRGREWETQQTIERALEETSDVAQRIALLERLGDLLWTSSSRSRSTAALDRYEQALEAAEAAGYEDHAVRLADILAEALLAGWDYDRALTLVADRLTPDRGSGTLWLRHGIVRWHQGALADAYASMTAALTYGVPRPSVLLYRGQVLTDWNRFEEAILELDEAIPQAPEPFSEASARSARAYALTSLGDFRKASVDLETATKLSPNNGLSYYFQGLCYRYHGLHEGAIYFLAQVVSSPHAVRSLSQTRVDAAYAILADYGVVRTEHGQTLIEVTHGFERLPGSNLNAPEK